MCSSDLGLITLIMKNTGTLSLSNTKPFSVSISGSTRIKQSKVPTSKINFNKLNFDSTIFHTRKISKKLASLNKRLPTDTTSFNEYSVPFLSERRKTEGASPKFSEQKITSKGINIDGRRFSFFISDHNPMLAKKSMPAQINISAKTDNSISTSKPFIAKKSVPRLKINNKKEEDILMNPFSARVHSPKYSGARSIIRSRDFAIAKSVKGLLNPKGKPVSKPSSIQKPQLNGKYNQSKAIQSKIRVLNYSLALRKISNMRLDKRQYLEYIIKEDLPGETDDMQKVITKIDRLKISDYVGFGSFDEIESRASLDVLDGRASLDVLNHGKLVEIVSDDECLVIEQIFTQKMLSASKELGKDGIKYMKSITSRIPFFYPFSDSVVEEMLNAARVIRVNKSMNIYKSDEIVNFMYIILKGKCVIFNKEPVYADDGSKYHANQMLELVEVCHIFNIDN